MSKRRGGDAVVAMFKETVEDFKAAVPVITDLGNTSMQDRHWRKVLEQAVAVNSPPIHATPRSALRHLRSMPCSPPRSHYFSFPAQSLPAPHSFSSISTRIRLVFSRLSAAFPRAGLRPSGAALLPRLVLHAGDAALVRRAAPRRVH
eukprot:6212443-Pleurochrysis_carterae.AAC.3